MGRQVVIDDAKINETMAKKKMSISKLAKAYGVSRSRIHVILNSRTITPVCAGRLAEALGVDVTEIMETEN